MKMNALQKHSFYFHRVSSCIVCEFLTVAAISVVMGHWYVPEPRGHFSLSLLELVESRQQVPVATSGDIRKK